MDITNSVMNDLLLMADETSFDQNLNKRTKIQFCRKFAKKYMMTMIVLFTFILGKRLIFETEKEMTRIMFHLLIIVLFFVTLAF